MYRMQRADHLLQARGLGIEGKHSDPVKGEPIRNAYRPKRNDLCPCGMVQNPLTGKAMHKPGTKKFKDCCLPKMRQEAIDDRQKPITPVIEEVKVDEPVVVDPLLQPGDDVAA